MTGGERKSMTRRAPTQAWTAEPWEVIPATRGGRVALVASDDSWFIATVCTNVDGDSGGDLHAARIVACVNALAGIPEPAEWRRRVEALKEAARPWAYAMGWDGADDRKVREAVRALLALEEPREENSDGE